MAVQAQFGGFAGCLPPCGGGLVEEQMRAALKDYGALMCTAGGGYGLQYDCAAGVVSGAQSELTCNGGGGAVGGVVAASRKRGREAAEMEQYVSSTSSAALLPIPGMHGVPAVAIGADRVLESAMASTSGRPAASASAADALVAELCRQGAEEVDALVRAHCDALRAGLERARKRQCQALARAAAAGAARVLREKEAELAAARRRAAVLEERLRQAAAESQAWCGLARSHAAVAAGLQSTLDTLLLRGVPAAAPAEGCGESGGPDGADDAQSCCFVEDARDAAAETAGAAATSPAAASHNKWACRGCGEGEASVLLLPCRHLCLCKACEPRADACPVCLAAKTGAIHVAAD